MCESNGSDEEVSSNSNEDKYGKASYDTTNKRARMIQTYAKY